MPLFLLSSRRTTATAPASSVSVFATSSLFFFFFFFFFDFWTYPRWCIKKDNNKVIGGVFLSQTDRQRNARDYSRVVSENNT